MEIYMKESIKKNSQMGKASDKLNFILLVIKEWILAIFH